METNGLQELSEERLEKIDLDPRRIIEEVTAEKIIQYNKAASPPFNGPEAPQREKGKQALVCEHGQCHWMPCSVCTRRGDCNFEARHPIHLTPRHGFIIKKRNYTNKKKSKWISKICECHPRKG